MISNFTSTDGLFSDTADSGKLYVPPCCLDSGNASNVTVEPSDEGLWGPFASFWWWRTQQHLVSKVGCIVVTIISSLGVLLVVTMLIF